MMLEFSRWDQQTEATKDKVRGFVENGQLEFINGGSDSCLPITPTSSDFRADGA